MVEPIMKCLAVLAMTLLSLPATAQDRRSTPEFRVYGNPASPHDGEAIEKIYTDFVSAWAQEDTQALKALHAENVEWVNAFGRVIRGSAALEDFMENRMFPGFDPAISKRDAEAMQLISMRYIGDEAAVLHFYTRSPRGSARTQDETSRLVYLHFILGKDEGEWKIEHVAIMDSR